MKARTVGSGDINEGIQVIDTTGVPAGYEPPSAALIPSEPMKETP